MTSANVGPSKGIPADGAVRVQFDRLLLPSSILRQSVMVIDASGAQFSPQPIYDPVARTVTLFDTPDKWLKPDQPYKVSLKVASSAGDFGVRAIDGANLNSPSPIGFITTAATGAGLGEPTMDYCHDVYPLFAERCSASSCHGARITGGDPARFGTGPSSPAAGLILETVAGVNDTAVNRVANGSNTGALSGRGSAPGPQFGVDMPIIDPGDPGNSWLLYKLLLGQPSDTTKPTAFPSCFGTNATTVKTACTSALDCTGHMAATGVTCDTVTTKLCVEGCSSDADCRAGALCDTKLFTCNTKPPTPLGGGCTADTDCGVGWRRACAIPTGAATGTCVVPFDPLPSLALIGFPQPQATLMADAERGVLSDFVLGREMPYPNMGPNGPNNGNPALTFEELERVRLWIQQGAHLPPNECTICP